MDRRPFNAPIAEPYPVDLRRCCRDSLIFNGPAQPPTKGIEVPCSWCDDTMLYDGLKWVRLSDQKIQP